MLVAGAIDGGGEGGGTGLGGSIDEESVGDGGIISDWGAATEESSGGTLVGRASINGGRGEGGGEESVTTGKEEVGVVAPWGVPGGISGWREALKGQGGSVGVARMSGVTIRGSWEESRVVPDG